MSLQTQQHTIQQTVQISGIGLHSGKPVSMTMLPAPENQGIVFERLDLGFPSAHPKLKLSAHGIQEALMCSSLIVDDIQVSTIEHLLSALCMLRIDNLTIQLDAPEIPILDGSAAPFIKYLEPHICTQKAKRTYIKIISTVRVEDEDKFVEIIPSNINTIHNNAINYHFKIQWDHPVINRTPRQITFNNDFEEYKQNIAHARTFGFYEQLEYLHKNNLALGASLENAIGISNDSILNPEGLRYPDEFVKHKLLDAIGDFYVEGPIIGHFNAYKSGHKLNNQLIRKILETSTAWETITL